MQRKIYFMFIVLLLVGVLTTGFLSLNLVRSVYMSNIEERMITNGELISNSINHIDDSELDFDEFTNEIASNIKARVTLIDKTGIVLGDSGVSVENLENHFNRPEINDAFNGAIGKSTRYSNTLKTDMYYVAIPYVGYHKELSVIRLAVPLENIEHFYVLLFKKVSIAIIAGLGLSFMLSIRYVKSVTNPIKRLTLASKKIAEGNFGERVYLRSDDELGELAKNFNVMSEKLQKKIIEADDKSVKMQAILSSMINGVVAVDNTKHIMFINPAAEKMFGFKEDDVRGKHILEILRSNDLDEQMQHLLHGDKVGVTEIELFEPNHRILSVRSNPIVVTSYEENVIGVVVLIQDVTEIRKLERVRKDFVANVSHELKTPLTSIKGFVETLKEGAAEEKEIRDKFIDIIDIESNRLSFLIDDILVLSDIEKRSTLNYKDEIDVNKSVKEVIEVLNEIAKKKDIKLTLNTQDGLKNVVGSEGWFKQMLINLIDNGIKYTGNSGEVSVTLKEENDNLVVSIKDTGIGIDEKDIPRLFERFYRVDKARSRAVGGTGLGLAIVKHIVISFDGEIEVKSVLGNGSEFLVSIPFKTSGL